MNARAVASVSRIERQTTGTDEQQEPTAGLKTPLSSAIAGVGSVDAAALGGSVPSGRLRRLGLETLAPRLIAVLAAAALSPRKVVQDRRRAILIAVGFSLAIFLLLSVSAGVFGFPGAFGLVSFGLLWRRLSAAGRLSGAQEGLERPGVCARPRPADQVGGEGRTLL